MGTPYNPIIDSELTAPLELPAEPGSPLTTQGGNTLDDGSGDTTIVGVLGVPGSGTSVRPPLHFTSLGPGSWGTNVGIGLDGSGNVVISAPNWKLIWPGNAGVEITSAGKVLTNPTTPALPTNPPVSGTVYQNTTGGPIIITVPITATAVGGSGQWALGSTNTPSNWGGAEQIGVSGEVHNMTLYVPNNWYWSITATSATIGTASVLGL